MVRDWFVRNLILPQVIESTIAASRVVSLASLADCPNCHVDLANTYKESNGPNYVEGEESDNNNGRNLVYDVDSTKNGIDHEGPEA